MDYSKYKRVFAFGCSFTHWHYPTWADIIAKSCTNAEFYNLGQGGGGNLFISSRITQANFKFNFCETDLILVMFSTPFREDRWIEGEWKLMGSIFNQEYYDKKFVRDYSDPVGLVIRDLTLVETTISYVKTLPCDNIMLRAVQLDSPEFVLSGDEKRYYEQIEFLYYNSMVSMLCPPLQKPKKPYTRPKVYLKEDGSKFTDYHPWPGDYLEYLDECNIPVSDEARQYAIDANNYVINATHLEDLSDHFACISNINGKYKIF